MISNFDPPPLPVKHPGGNVGAGVRAMGQMGAIADSQRIGAAADTAAQPVEFSHAITYVNKIKVSSIRSMLVH